MKKNKRIAIISSKKFANKIKEDLLFRDMLLSCGEQADIVAWEDKNIVWKDYKCAILRSAWGYHKQVDEFLSFLQNLKKFNIKFFNDVNVIAWNINKEHQFNDLKKLGINVLPCYVFKEFSNSTETEILQFLSSQKTSDFVFKPIISGSGDNTFFVSLDNGNHLKNQLSLKEAQDKFKSMIYSKEIKGCLVQPYLPDIVNGEYSFIFIDSQLTHAAIRYPGVFLDKKESIEVDISSLPSKMVKFAYECEDALKIISTRFSKQSSPLYARYDVVDSKSNYFLMEAELAEPDLLIKTITSDEKKKAIIKRMVDSLLIRSRQ